MYRKGFTLLELLIVIAILAVLATVAVLVINPAEYLKQSRDAKRVTDLTVLNKALAFAEFSGLSMGGASTTVFVSLVDTVATCTNLGLPTLPTGYQYRCVTTVANLRKTDSTGWIPVNLGSVTGGSPLAVLPIDPTNNVTTFYTYIPGGSFALSASLESEKYIKQLGVTDGGNNPVKLEAGSDTKLLARAEGLVGYWALNEGSGAVAGDSSGGGNGGTLYNGTSWTDGAVGKAASFNGLNNSIEVADQETLKYKGGDMTISAWIYPNVTEVTGGKIISKPWNGTGQYNYWIFYGASGRVDFFAGGATNYTLTSVSVLPKDTWSYVTGVIKADGSMALYVNGVQDAVGAHSIVSWIPGLGDINRPLTIGTLYPYGGAWAGNTSYSFDGKVDDARMYKRAVPSAEIKAIYDATK